MGVAVALMLVFLILGFLIGTRARQVAASIKNVGAALKSFSFKIPSLTPLQAAAAGAEGADDDERDDGDDDDNEIDLDKYVQPVEGDTVLADHPDLQISPVILYNIKKAKSELRLAQRRTALLAEGMSEQEADEQMELEMMSGSGGGGGGKMNALAMLISVGARVEATGGSGSAEQQALQDRRRLQRNVDGYLNRVHGVEKLRVADQKNKATRDAEGNRIKTANEVAKETAVSRAGGLLYQREVANLRFATEARGQYRVYQAEQTKLGLNRPTREVVSEARARGGLGDINMGDLAAIQAEFENDGDDDAGEEGDEDLDDEDEDDADLAA